VTTRPTADAPGVVAEETEVHTRILRLALGVEESRAYWAHVAPAVPLAERTVPAFEERWFGAKSIERVRTLLSYCAFRYDVFPSALQALRHLRNLEPAARQAICHWHLQLSDPLYRQFSAGFLLERRTLLEPKVDRPAVARWVRTTWPNRWSEATVIQFASKLLSAASEAGLITPRRDPRALLFPKVPDLALAYLLYLLREVRHTGTLTENPYLDSVGLGGGVLDQRLRTIPSISLRRMGGLVEFDWTYPSLLAWAEAVS